MFTVHACENVNANVDRRPANIFAKKNAPVGAAETVRGPWALLQTMIFADSSRFDTIEPTFALENVMSKPVLIVGFLRPTPPMMFTKKPVNRTR